MQAVAGFISRGTRGNAVPMVKVLKNAHELAVHALWTALRTIFGQNALDCRILHIQYQKFSGVIPPDFRRIVPGVWTQTPISAWLISVSIVPVLRNDHLAVINVARPLRYFVNQHRPRTTQF